MRSTTLLLVFRICFSALLVVGLIMAATAIIGEWGAVATLAEKDQTIAYMTVAGKGTGAILVLAAAAFGLWALGGKK